MLKERAVTYSLSLLLLGNAAVRLYNLQVIQLSHQRQCTRLGCQLLVGPVFSGCDPCGEVDLEQVSIKSCRTSRKVARRRKRTPAQLPDEQLHLGNEAPGTQTPVHFLFRLNS